MTAGVRGMTTTESAGTLTMYQLMMLSVTFGLSMPFAFKMPTGIDTLWLLLNGAGNGIAQYWWTRAIHMAPTGAVVPFNYLNLVWAAMLGFAIWGDVPTIGLVIGSAIVVGSGLFLLWHETRKAKAAAGGGVDCYCFFRAPLSVVGCMLPGLPPAICRHTSSST